MNEISNLHHLLFLHSARRDCRRADTDSTSKCDLLGVERDAVLVHSDAGVIERFLRELAVQPTWAEIDEHEVIVGAAAGETIAVLGWPSRQGLGIADNLRRIDFEARLKRLVEAHGFCRDYMLERTALDAGEDLAIDRLLVLLLTRSEEHTSELQSHSDL